MKRFAQHYSSVVELDLGVSESTVSWDQSVLKTKSSEKFQSTFEELLQEALMEDPIFNR